MPHGPIPPLDIEKARRQMMVQYKFQTREHLFKNCLQLEEPAADLWATVLEVAKKHPGTVRGRYRTK